MEYAFSYLPCQTCTARIHCRQCGEELAECLLLRPDVKAADVDMENKRISLTAPDADEDELLDALEVLGVFV